MKLKTIFELIKGKRDIKSLMVLNKLFGKKCLFIEKQNIYKNEIIKYLNNHKVKEVFLLIEEEKEIPEEILNLLKEKKIKINLHVHLIPDTTKISYEKKYIKTARALDYLITNFILPTEVAYGYWRFSYKDPELKKIVNKLNLKLSKRRWHIYDYWLI